MAALTVFLLPLLIAIASFAPIPQTSDSGEVIPTKRRKSSPGPRCFLRFSEIQLAWNRDRVTSPFLELKASCPKKPGPFPKNALAGYVVLIIQEDPISIAAVMDFDNFPFDDSKSFVVIGSPDVPNVDISTATLHIQSIFSRTEAKLMLPIPKDRNYALMLLGGVTKHETRSFNLYFGQDAIMVKRVLTTDQIKLIATKLVDMVTVGSPENLKTSQFGYFWPEKDVPMFSDTQLSEMDTAEADMSLSVCSPDYNGFNSESYQIKQQSPGIPNLCGETESSFSTTTEQPVPVDQPTEASHPLLHLITENDLDDVRNHRFVDAWIPRCQNSFPKKSNMLEKESVQSWINFPGDDCRFTCSACQKYIKIGFRPDVKTKTNVMTSGFLSRDIYDNGDAIKAHEKTPIHTEAIQFFNRIRMMTTPSEAASVISDFEEKEKATFNATMNNMLLAYAGIKAGTSFQAHEIFSKAVERMGAHIGIKHHTGEAAQSIAYVFARSFRSQMMNALVKAGEPFSISVDGSTGFGIPYLAVYIQVLENGRLVTHFYSLIHMAEGEKYKQMTQSFIQQIELDDSIVPGWKQYFISKFVAFSSDGAAVMIGVKESFKTYLGKFIGREAPNIVCLAHRLDSSYKAGMKPNGDMLDELDDEDPDDAVKIWQLNFFQSFEKTSNELYTFYASRGYKKWQHLLNTAAELGIVPKRVKYVYDIRWSESHYRSLETVHHNYYALVEDLDQIRASTTKEFDQSARNNAEIIYERMTDKTYMIVMHEFLDILTTFKIASLKFQVASSTVVGKVEVVNEVIKALEDYKKDGGSWVKDFLKQIACSTTCDGGECTLQMYDDCSEVIINGITLQNHYDVLLPYADVREALYDNLVASVEHYFDLSLLEAFEVFNPRRFVDQLVSSEGESVSLDDLYHNDPSAPSQKMYSSQAARLEFICKFYGIGESNCGQLVPEWEVLLLCLVSQSDTRANVKEDFANFWSLAVTVCQGSWTPLTKTVLGYAMVTPFSSSQVERGFSVMNGIKTKGRSRLEKATLDALMTVKINGPDVDQIYMYKYAIEFLKVYSRSDDTTKIGGRKRNEEKAKDSLPTKSQIYRR